MIKWIVFIVSVWIVLALLGGIIEGAYLGSDEAGVMNTLMTTPLFTETGFLARVVGTFFDGEFWGAIATMFLFDFAFFSGGYAVIQWIFFFPFVVALIIAFISTARGVSPG